MDFRFIAQVQILITFSTTLLLEQQAIEPEINGYTALNGNRWETSQWAGLLWLQFQRTVEGRDMLYMKGVVLMVF